MVNGRAKGATWERKLAKMLEAELGIRFERNLEQYRSADGGDLIPDNDAFPFSIEAKHYASGVGCKAAWWEQSQKAAVAAGKLPCVIYKYDRRETRCVVSLDAIARLYGERDDDGYLLELSIEGFCYLARELMPQ